MSRGIGAGSNGNGNTPLSIGGSLSVRDSTELANLDPFGLPIGTRVYHQGLLDDFELVLSNAGLVTDQIIAVLGTDGCRWVRVNASSGDFAGYAVQYVHPDGDNKNDGTLNSPKKTRAAAYLALADGGQIFTASNTVWSDGSEVYTDHNGPHTLTAGVGMRLTGWAQGPTRPDFVPFKSVLWYGWGTDLTVDFGGTGVLWNHGTGLTSDRTDPGTWLGPYCLEPTMFQDINFAGNLLFRQGWDYRRNDDADASIAWAGITGAVRTAGVDTQHTSSVFTVGFPQAWTIEAFGRAAGVVTVQVAMPLQPAWPPIQLGQWVRITSTTAGFGSIDVQCASPPSQNGTASHVTFTYNQAGGDVTFPFAATAGGTVKSHCCNKGDIIEVESTNFQWPTTIYEVQAATIDTVTVRDPYGYDASGWGGAARTASATGSNIGQYVLQDRQLTLATDLTSFNNCSGQYDAFFGAENFNVGPLMDFGSSLIPPTLRGGGFAGIAFDPNGGIAASADYFRSASVFLYSGSNGAGGIDSLLTNFINGNILFQPALSQPWQFSVQRHLQDAAPTNLGTNFLRPVFEVIDNGVVGGGTGFINQCFNSDSAISATAPTVYLAQVGGCVTTIGCLFTNTNPASGYVSTDAMAKALVINERRTWAADGQSYEAAGKVGWYGNDARLAGKRMDVQGQFGVVQGTSLVNALPADLSTWSAFSGGSVAAAAGHSTAELDGGNNAFRITGSGQLCPASAPLLLPSVIGDRYVFGAWVRGVSGSKLPANVIFTIANDVQFVCQYFSGLGGDGEWQWITSIGQATVAAGTGSPPDVSLYADGVHSYDIAYPTVLRLPIATYSINDAFRIMNTFRPFPAYLAAGMAGSMTGQKLVAHGGLGTGPTARYTVGVASGNITLGAATGKAVQLFDEAGNSLGVVAPLSFTVNP